MTTLDDALTEAENLGNKLLDLLMNKRGERCVRSRVLSRPGAEALADLHRLVQVFSGLVQKSRFGHLDGDKVRRRRRVTHTVRQLDRVPQWKKIGKAQKRRARLQQPSNNGMPRAERRDQIFSQKKERIIVMSPGNTVTQHMLRS